MILEAEMIEDSSYDDDKNKELKSSQPGGASDNLDGYFETIFDENLNLVLNEEEFKKTLSDNYYQIIRMTEQRAKFLVDYDQIKEQLSQAHKKIFGLVDKKNGNDINDEKEHANEDLSDNESSESDNSNGDLDDKVEDYIEKKNEGRKESKLTVDNGAQSFFKTFLFDLKENRRNGRSSF